MAHFWVKKIQWGTTTKKGYGQVGATLHFVLMKITICTRLKYEWLLNMYNLSG